MDSTVHPKLVVTGTLAFDDIETPAGKRTRILGGSATHFSLTASKFTKVAVKSIVGGDFGEQHFAVFRDHGIDTSQVEIGDGDTFYWKGHYLDDMNLATTLDTRLNVVESYTPKLTDEYAKADSYFLANTHPDMQTAIVDSVNKEKKPLLVADTMNLWISTTREQLTELIKKVDILILNDRESMQYSGCDNIYAAGRHLLGLGLKCVVIKRAEYGVYLTTADRAFAMPAYPVEKVVDPTGAGDCFAGGFLGSLISDDYHNNPSFTALCKAAFYGTASASFSVEQFGADALVQLERKHIDERYNQLLQLTQISPK